jgi:hypothetical protein
MSTSLLMEESSVDQTAVAESTVAAMTGALERLARTEQAVILGLSTLTDEQLAGVRRNARALGQTAWRVEAAVDAEVVRRAVRQRGGRGRPDVAGTGAQRRIAERAREAGVTPATVRTNARVHALWERNATRVIARPYVLGDDPDRKTTKSDFHTLGDVLQDKAYWQAALRAPDPDRALLEMAGHKLSDPRFRPADAARMLDEEERAPITVDADRLARVADERIKAAVQHIERTINLLRTQVIPDCPDARLADRLYFDFLEELNESLNDLMAGGAE